MLCDAPNPGTEMRCQREAGHEAECYSKYKIFYENEIVSWGEMWWNKESQVTKEADDVQQLRR